MCTWKLFDNSLTLTGRMPCTVSSIEKLTNRTEPRVLFRCGRGTVEVRSWYGRSAVVVRSWYGSGARVIRSRFGRGAVMVRSRCGQGTL